MPPTSRNDAVETPRTDAHLAHLNLPDGRKIGLPDITVEFCRELERLASRWQQIANQRAVEVADLRHHADITARSEKLEPVLCDSAIAVCSICQEPVEQHRDIELVRSAARLTMAEALAAGGKIDTANITIRDAPRSSERAPIPMLMFCPRCSKQHIDAPKGDWTNPPHATHACQHCGLLWRPSNENTTGVSGITLLEAKHAERIAASFPVSATSPFNGYVLVPEEPTQEMLDAARYARDCPVTGTDDLRDLYLAMVQARPEIEGEAEGAAK